MEIAINPNGLNSTEPSTPATLSLPSLPVSLPVLGSGFKVKPYLQVSNVFWWLNLVRFYSSYKILYPKRKIESYSIMGTIISPNKILLN